MELEEWLKVYQAITLTAGVKERGYWTIAGLFLLANCLLILSLALFSFFYTMWEGRFFATALSGIGVLICLCWLISQQRAAREVSHWGSLLRSIEGQFAGGEFHRSLYKLLYGEEVCIPATSWKCNEWYPEVERLSRLGRITPQTLIGLLPVVFLLAWVALTITRWLV